MVVSLQLEHFSSTNSVGYSVHIYSFAFFFIKNTMFWGCVRWGNQFFINFLKNNVHQQWGFTFFSKKQKCVLKQKPFKNLLCFRGKSKNRQLLRNGSEAQCGVNCFAYFFVLRFFSQSKIALVNFLHFQEKTCFFFNIYPASLYDNFLSMCCGLDSFFHMKPRAKRTH